MVPVLLLVGIVRVHFLYLNPKICKYQIFSTDKPIGASPGRDYVLTRMVHQIILYSTRYGMIHKKGGECSAGYGLKEKERSMKVF